MNALQNVYVEWFLLDNALMAYLILRSAAAMARLPTRRFLICAISALAAIVSVAAMLYPAFRSIPAKALLFLAMTLPLGWKGKAQWGRGAICVLASTFFFGGMAYALAFLFESDFRGGVLYASTSVRAVLVAAVVALWVPGYIRKALRINRLSRTRLTVGIDTKFGSVTLGARLDSGLDLLVDDAPVVVIDAKAAAAVLPAGWPEGRWFECGVASMGLLPFRDTSGSGVMPTLPATVSWRWEEASDEDLDAPSHAQSPETPAVKAAGAFWEDSRSSKEKRRFKRNKHARRKAEKWLETRGCRIAVATAPLADCGALVGLDFVELH